MGDKEEGGGQKYQKMGDVIYERTLDIFEHFEKCIASTHVLRIEDLKSIVLVGSCSKKIIGIFVNIVMYLESRFLI